MKKLAYLAMVLAALALGFLLRPALSPAPAGGEETAADASGEREILYWVAPMDPNFRRDKPGKSPMGMDLVPVYADDAPTAEGVTISPSVEHNLGVRTALAEVRPLWRKIEATGYVGFDETRISHIHLRTQGWIVRLAVAAEGEQVRAGDLLFELYAPELVNAQKEFLQAQQRGDPRLQRGAEEKLRALGMVQAEIARLARDGKASENIQVLAPHDGVVAELGVREGMYVQPNVTVMSLAGLSTVWLVAEVFESQAEWVARGQAAEARLDYLPGTVFSGQVDYVYPVLDPQTRTLRVRLRFDNADGRLKPNMYARVSIYGKLQPNALVVPRESLIRAPGRDRVVLALGGGRFHVHEVMTGLESGEWVEILAGIDEGDRVVTSAQFLIDSEASLAGSIQRLESEPRADEPRPAETVIASGQVEAVDTRRRALRIAHGPIEELGWPSMRMEFDVDPEVSLEGVQRGDNLRFALRQEHAGHWVISGLDRGRELESLMPDAVRTEAETEEPKPPRYAARAEVRGIDLATRKLTLAHGPVKELGWPAMTMDFPVAETVDIGALAVGQEIHFFMTGTADGAYRVEEIHVMPGAGDHD